MYPAPFDYLRAASVAEALAALAAHPDGQLLAGGHSLLPALKLRLAQPALLIDIGRLQALAGVERRAGRLRIGALTCHDRVARSPEVAAGARLLAEACAKVGDPAVRNWGTLGGNLAHADPASDPPAALAAAGAELELTSAAGVRRVAAADFFSDLFVTQLGPGGDDHGSGTAGRRRRHGIGVPQASAPRLRLRGMRRRGNGVPGCGRPLQRGAAGRRRRRAGTGAGRPRRAGRRRVDPGRGG